MSANSEPPPDGLLRDYGEQWQITRDAGAGYWIAVERPPVPVQKVFIAETPEELREILDAVPEDGS